MSDKDPSTSSNQLDNIVVDSKDIDEIYGLTTLVNSSIENDKDYDGNYILFMYMNVYFII